MNFLLCLCIVNPLCFLLCVSGASHKQKLLVACPIIFSGYVISYIPQLCMYQFVKFLITFLNIFFYFSFAHEGISEHLDEIFF